MLKYITKAMNATTRVIIGNTNPSLTARTHAIDTVMAERHELKKNKELTVSADTKLVQRLDVIMGRQGTEEETKLTPEQGFAMAEEADVEEDEVEVEEMDTPDTTTYQDDTVESESVDTEKLDKDIEDALLAHAKKRHSYEAVCKGRNKNKDALKKRLAKEVEETAQAVLDAMQFAAQYEYANTASIRAKLEIANGKNVVDAVRSIMP